MGVYFSQTSVICFRGDLAAVRFIEVSARRESDCNKLLDRSLQLQISSVGVLLDHTLS